MCLHVKNGIRVIIQSKRKFFLVWMLHSLKINHALSKILFKVENNEWEDHFWEVSASLSLPTVSSSSISIPLTCSPTSNRSSIVDCEQSLKRKTNLHNREHQPATLC